MGGREQRGGGGDNGLRENVGGGMLCCSQKKGKIGEFFRHNKIHNMVTNLKAVSFGSLGSRPFTPPNRLLISLGVPFGGVKSDMAW